MQYDVMPSVTAVSSTQSEQQHAPCTATSTSSHGFPAHRAPWLPCSPIMAGRACPGHHASPVEHMAAWQHQRLLALTVPVLPCSRCVVRRICSPPWHGWAAARCCLVLTVLMAARSPCTLWEILIADSTLGLGVDLGRCSSCLDGSKQVGLIVRSAVFAWRAGVVGGGGWLPKVHAHTPLGPHGDQAAHCVRQGGGQTYKGQHWSRVQLLCSAKASPMIGKRCGKLKRMHWPAAQMHRGSARVLEQNHDQSTDAEQIASQHTHPSWRACTSTGRLPATWPVARAAPARPSQSERATSGPAQSSALHHGRWAHISCIQACSRSETIGSKCHKLCQANWNRNICMQVIAC
jgi:hypothetical protein